MRGGREVETPSKQQYTHTKREIEKERVQKCECRRKHKWEEVPVAGFETVWFELLRNWSHNPSLSLALKQTMKLP